MKMPFMGLGYVMICCEVSCIYCALKDYCKRAFIEAEARRLGDIDCNFLVGF